MVREARTSARSKTNSEAESRLATTGDDSAWLSSTWRHHSPRVRPEFVQRLSSVFHSSWVMRVLMVRTRTLVGDFITMHTLGRLDESKLRAAPDMGKDQERSGKIWKGRERPDGKVPAYRNGFEDRLAISDERK